MKKTKGSELVTRAILKEELEGLNGAVAGLNGSVAELKTGQKELDKKLDRIQNTLDGFVGTVDDLKIDNTVGADQIKELGDKTDNHEKRITALEQAA